MTIDGLTDPLGSSQILPYLGGLSKDYELHIITLEKEDKYELNKHKIEETIKSFGIMWYPLFFKSRVPVLSQYKNFKALKKKALEVAAEFKPSVIHCRSLVPAIIGKKIKKKHGGKLLFDMRGFWADERVEGEIWNTKNPVFANLYSSLKKKEKELFQTADSVVSLTNKAKDFILKEYAKDQHITVIPCCVDTDKFSYPRNQDKLVSLRKQYQLADKAFVLLYLGSLGTRYELHEMLRFFKAIQAERSDAIFLIVTNSPTVNIHESAVSLNINESALRITSAAAEDVPDYIAVSSASLFFIKTGFSGKAVSPTKQAEALIMGIPIVSNPGIGDTDTFIRDNQLGIVVNDYSDTSLSTAAKELLATNYPKDELRKFAQDHLSLKNGVESYREVYLNLMEA